MQITTHEGIGDKIPERCWIPLLVLYRLGKVVTAIKLQKLIFLIQDKARIKQGYDFFKYHYGPYSAELELDTFLLSEAYNFISIEYKRISHPTGYYIYTIMPEGNAAFETILPSLNPELVRRADRCLEKFGSWDHYKLVEYVYEEYLPKKHAYEERFTHVKNDLESISSFWQKTYSPDCPASIDVLSVVEYIELAFKQMEMQEDEVTKGVILSAAAELSSKLIDVTSTCAEEEMCVYDADKCKASIDEPRLFELFDFLISYCESKGVLSKLEELDFADIILEEDFRRLKKSLSDLDVGSTY
ncbi:MAG: hypothetical protein QMC77_05070 [Methanocellales archaeon]|nr:hypothetical protein [Methanocellales archaeon]